MELPRRSETGSGETLEYASRYLYSTRNPAGLPRKLAESLPIKPNTLYLLPSPLLLHGVVELARRLPSSSILVLVEADPVLSKLSLKELTRRADAAVGRLPFFCGTQAGPILNFLKKLPDWPFRRVEMPVLNGGYALNRGEYDRLRDELEREIRILYQDRITMVYLARRWMKNLFMTLGAGPLPPSFRRLATIRPVVVVGAGESLEASLSELKQKRREIYLLAVDTALPVLSGAGIIPDAAVVLESQFINLRDFYGVRLQDIDLIADLSSYPEVFRLPWRNRWAFFSRFAELAYIRKRIEPLLAGYELPPYGSVGICAAAIAAEIGSSAIYLTGLDFAYRLGKSHARGTQFQTEEQVGAVRPRPAGSYRLFFNRPLMKLEGKGGAVLSDLILLNYSLLLRQLAGEETGAGRYFDLNPGGLDLGIPHSPAIRLETEAAPTATAPVMPSEEPKKSVSAQKLIVDEIQYLTELYRVGTEFLRTGAAAGAVWEEIEEHDYLYAHFPERFPPQEGQHGREGSESSSFPREAGYIKRLLVAVEAYRRYLNGIAGG